AHFFTFSSPSLVLPSSLHDALPILYDRVLRDLCVASRDRLHRSGGLVPLFVFHPPQSGDRSHADPEAAAFTAGYPSRDSPFGYRSEEHTSELQSRVDLVCRLLLEKK